jgi:addiction module RelE/StbE family toxin
MGKVGYSQAAIQDLERIGDYIAAQLQNPIAALNTVEKIQNRIDKLAEFPNIGMPLSSVAGIETDRRFLICGSYLAFYRVNDSQVFIDRILYGKRDYIAILFEGVTFEEDFEEE